MADCSGDCFRYRRHGAVVVMSSHFRLLLVVATTLYVAGFSSIACHPMTSESNELHQRGLLSGFFLGRRPNFFVRRRVNFFTYF